MFEKNERNGEKKKKKTKTVAGSTSKKLKKTKKHIQVSEYAFEHGFHL